MNSPKYFHFYISFFLVFWLGINPAAQIALAASFERQMAEQTIGSLFAGQAKIPSTEINTSQQDVKAAVIREVTTYLNQFKGTCFGDKFSIGNPANYQAAIDKNIYRIIVGQEGIDLVSKRPDSKAYHDDTGWLGLLMANIVFPFDPDKLEEKSAYDNRRTMAHELTHHMEYQKGVKVKEKPRSERNTDYQDSVVDKLKQLVQIEKNLAENKSNIAEELTRWGNVETELRKLETEGLAGGNPPDEKLNEMTGFDAKFDKIEEYYLSGKCGEKLKNLVLLYRLLPRIKQSLDFEPLTIKLGEEAVGKAVLEDTNYSELKIPAELKPKFEWTLPDEKISNENPLRFKPEKEGSYTVPVKLNVTFDKEDFLVARGDFIVTVNPDETTPLETVKTKITAPKEILATELFDAKAIVPANLQGKIARSEWSPNSCAAQPGSLAPKLQFRNPYGGKVEENQVLLTIFDAQNNRLDSVSVPVTVKPVVFGGSVPDVWEGGSHPGGVNLKRKEAVRKRMDKGKEINSARVNSAVEVKWDGYAHPQSLEDIQKELLKRKGSDTNKTISPITVAGWKGLILETNGVTQDFTGSGFVDAGSPSAMASGIGYAVKGCMSFEFSYYAGGSGAMLGDGAGFGKPEHAWWNDTPFLLSQSRAAAAEAKAILAGLQLAPDETISKMPYKGRKLDGSDLPTVKLTLSPDVKKLKKGDSVNVRAVVENAQPEDLPLEFVWTGEHAGSGASVKFSADKPGKQTLSVNVKNIGAAAVEFEVADFKAEIKQVSPTANKINIGTPVTFSAQLLSGGAPVSGNYVYRWQPQPEAKFDPAEGANKQTKAVFSAPGKMKVWVQILERKGEILQTVAESDQIEIEVVAAPPKVSPAAESIKRGEALHNEKKYNEAIREFDAAIKADPTNADAYRRRAMSKREKDDLQGAVKDFDRAIELDPKNSRAFLGRGLVREKLGEAAVALGDYTRGIELDPKYPNGYLYRGTLRIEQKDYPGAISDFDRVIALDPKNRTAFINRGLAKDRAGDTRGAVGDYDEAIKLDPNYSLTYNNRGSAKEKLGDTQGALADYEKAVQLDPANELAKNNLAKLKAKISGAADAATPTETSTGKEIEILNVNNIYGVSNHPTAPTQFTLTKPHRITYVFTYHWNNARGTPKPGYIGFYNSAGQTFGPWQATGTPGQGGVANANWEARPNVVIPAGTYTIVVSEMDTWSQNPQSGGRGFAIIKGFPTSGEVSAPQPTPKLTPQPTRQPAGVIVIAIFQNRSSENAHIFAEGDSFGQHNLLAPGATKEVSLRMTADGRIKFFAGRNGQVIATKIWTGDPSDTNRFPRVIFDGTSLIVMTGLR